ncbi:Cytochrome P450 6j1, partial [Blattella germanica]
YPPIAFLDRLCSEDYELPDPSGKGKLILPKGTGIFIPVLGIHYDPEFYPEPEKFDPERFTEDNKQNRPHFAYLPFGNGPRICIGKFVFLRSKMWTMSSGESC